MPTSARSTAAIRTGYDGPARSCRKKSQKAGRATAWTATRKRHVEQVRAAQKIARSTGAARSPSHVRPSRSCANERERPTSAVKTIATQSIPVAARVPPARVVPPRPNRKSTNAAPHEDRHRRHHLAAAQLDEQVLANERPQRPHVHAASFPAAIATTRPPSPSNHSGSWVATTIVRPGSRGSGAARRGPRRRAPPSARRAARSRAGAGRRGPAPAAGASRARARRPGRRGGRRARPGRAPRRRGSRAPSRARRRARGSPWPSGRGRRAGRGRRSRPRGARRRRPQAARSPRPRRARTWVGAPSRGCAGASSSRRRSGP